MTKFELWSSGGPRAHVGSTKLGTYDTLGEAQEVLDQLIKSCPDFNLHIISVKG